MLIALVAFLVTLICAPALILILAACMCVGQHEPNR